MRSSSILVRVNEHPSHSFVVPQGYEFVRDDSGGRGHYSVFVYMVLCTKSTSIKNAESQLETQFVVISQARCIQLQLLIVL
jgi:hypothetical protein